MWPIDCEYKVLARPRCPVSQHIIIASSCRCSNQGHRGPQATCKQPHLHVMAYLRNAVWARNKLFLVKLWDLGAGGKSGSFSHFSHCGKSGSLLVQPPRSSPMKRKPELDHVLSLRVSVAVVRKKCGLWNGTCITHHTGVQGGLQVLQVKQQHESSHPMNTEAAAVVAVVVGPWPSSSSSVICQLWNWSPDQIPL